MRLLWQRHGDGSGVPEDGVEKAAAEVAEKDLTPFFDRALRSTEELDYSVFSHVGLEVRFRMRESTSESNTLSIFPPAIPKIYSTPCASRLLTSRSAPVCVTCSP